MRDNISVDENIDMEALAKVARSAGKSFGGNMQLTVALLLGDANDAKRDAVRCIDQAGEGGGLILAPGCDLPYAVKPENLEAVASLIGDDDQIKIARNLPAKDTNETFDDIIIPNYAEEDAVIVDVVTLDSLGCAPCAYMVKAAQEAAKAYGKAIEVREHKITGRDGLGYMTKLGATAIPSLCVDGNEAFASIIPDRKDLVAVYAAAASVK